MITGRANGLFAIYIHWPFCAAKCPYCDFNSHVRLGGINEARFLNAYLAELDHMRGLTGPRDVLILLTTEDREAHLRAWVERGNPPLAPLGAIVPMIVVGADRRTSVLAEYLCDARGERRFTGRRISDNP